jgi:hypothetical protein
VATGGGAGGWGHDRDRGGDPAGLADDSSHAIGNFEFEAALPYTRGERLRRDHVIKGSM